MAKFLIGMAILFSVSALAAPPLLARKDKLPKAYTCMAVAYYGNRRMVAEQDFTPTGQPVDLARSEASADIPPEVATPIRVQLTADVLRMGSDPALNCSPAKGDWQKYAYYGCAEAWSDGPDQFWIGEDGGNARMIRTMPSGMSLQLGWSDNSSDGDPREGHYAKPDFLRDGLSVGGTYRSVLHFELPAPWGRANAVRIDKQGNWLEPKTEVGEARIGQRVYREWSGANFVVVVRPEVLDELRKSEGDLVITAYSTVSGVVAQEIFPRDLHQQTEAKLKAGYRRLMIKQTDPVRNCQRQALEIGPPIIISG